MDTFESIRRGLAANLAVLDDYQISPYFLDNPTPSAIQVAGVEEITYDTSFRSSGGTVTHDTLKVQIEVCLQRVTEIAAQKQLDTLLGRSGPLSLTAAIEADNRLTSRLLDNKTLLTGQDPACDDVHVEQFRGQSRHVLSNGVEVLLAVFTVEVVT